MIDINEDELHALIGDLDERIGKEGAIVRLSDDCEVETVIVANYRGYLRLGVEFLKAAYQPLQPESYTGDAIEVDLPYLFGQREVCWQFRRREHGLPHPEGMRGNKTASAMAGIGCLLVGAFLFGSLLAGMPIVAGSVLRGLAQVLATLF